MSETVTGTAPLPVYARRMTAEGGSFKRFWLHWMLRLTVRRAPVLGEDIGVQRAKHERLDAKFGRVDPAVRRTPVDASGVACEWLEFPEGRAERVLLYFHGGAFMLRFPRTHAALVGGWCRTLGARALMVDYRLAPEHRYPAAPDDCHAAYRWLLAQGVMPANIVLGGDSAGGNLVLATLLRIKAAGEPMPRCAVLLSPVVDFTLSSISLIHNEATDPMFTFAKLAAIRTLYASPERFLEPSLSPLFGDFAGLPPLLFQASGDEALLDESTRAAARAHAAGVPVEFEIWDKMVHVFQALPVPQAQRANQRITDFIRRQTQW